MKIRRIITATVLLGVLLSFGAVYSDAFRGSGIEVVAKDVGVVKSGLLGRKLCFSDADFKSAFAIADFDSVTVTELPPSTDGLLLLAGRRVREGQVIKRRNVAAMVFVPASREVAESSFSFKIDGGREHIFKLCFLEKINYAPQVRGEGEASISLTTQREISTYGRLSGVDPEGDALSYIIVSYPTSGSLHVSDEGAYRYTPDDGYTGKDSFTYVVRDAYGNYSEPDTVTLRVIERMSEVVYSDMTDRAEYNAGVALTAMGIMTGSAVGGEMHFEPDKCVSRAEFVTMAMRAAGIRPVSGESCFDDNASIPDSMVGYVAAAGRLGIVNGELVGGRLLFAPNEKIALWEAADIMSRILGSGEDLEAKEYLSPEGVPVWARNGVCAMVTFGIIDGTEDLTKQLTRATAAEYIYKMVNNS